MVGRRKLEIPELFPQPKFLEATGGDSDLALDVRLVTRDVSPLQRKAVRSILTAAGVRVVANKKKYVVDARVEEHSSFELDDVPAACRKDYYELRVTGSEVYIRSPEQEGAVWASHTLASLFRHVIRGHDLPNLQIRDWPQLPVRGVFVENKWGPDRMCLADWYQTIDEMAAVKLNTIGVGLYGCWGRCRFENGDRPSEFLMVPVPEHDELKHEQLMRWYSAEQEEWKAERYLPAMYEGDFFQEVEAYGRERGVRVVPFVNSLGHNTLIPRTLPELSAKDAKGEATGVGYCTSIKETRDFIEAFYGSILERYFPMGTEYFHIQLDEVWPDHPWPEEPSKLGEPWCQCKLCEKLSREELFQNYVLWLVEMLVKKGVKKVVMWNDQLTRHMDALDSDFVARLQAANLQDHLVLHWWWYNNDALHERTRVSLGKEHGIAGWVAPMTCYYNWSTYDYRLPNIDMMLRMCEKEGGDGAVSYAVHDPSHLDHEALLAAYTWESTKGQSMDKVLKRWKDAHFGVDARKYSEATEKIRSAVQEPFYAICLQYQYSYVGKGDNGWPRLFPEEALKRLEAEPASSKVSERLQSCLQLGKEADALLLKMLDNEELIEAGKGCLLSLRGEALRIQAIAGLFDWLLALRADLQSGSVKKSQVTACTKARSEYCRLLEEFEKCKPQWVTPAALQALSLSMAFLDQLLEELKSFAGKKKAAELRWHAELPPPPPPSDDEEIEKDSY
jgi:hypothetical protein